MLVEFSVFALRLSELCWRQVLHLVSERRLHLPAQLRDAMLRSVESGAVADDQVEIGDEFGKRAVPLVLQLLVDCAQVYRVFDHLWIGWKVERHIVYRCSEVLREVALFQV